MWFSNNSPFPLPSSPVKDHLIWLWGSLPVVCNFFCISFYHGDLMPHFCYILFKIGDEDKRMELLETSLFLAPASQDVWQRGISDPLLLCPSQLPFEIWLKHLFLYEVLSPLTLQFTTWLRPQDDTALSKVLKRSFLAKPSHLLSFSPYFILYLHSFLICKVEDNNGPSSQRWGLSDTMCAKCGA